MRKPVLAVLVAASLTMLLMASAVAVLRARQAGGGGELRYVNGSSLALPSNYRELMWVSSNLGLVYEGEASRPDRPPVFTNVFVNPSSYRAFLDSGKWPDKTIFILEFRASSAEGSFVTGGRFQGALLSVEAEVKDAKFADGWAFYNFGGGAQGKTVTEPIADATRCVDCHTKNTAVERTFVQFYPTLFEAARTHGTVKPGF